MSLSLKVEPNGMRFRGDGLELGSKVRVRFRDVMRPDFTRTCSKHHSLETPLSILDISLLF